MVCVEEYTPHHSHRLLRSFRSLKTLRGDAQPSYQQQHQQQRQQQQSQQSQRRQHERVTSQSSSTKSPRPSYSRTENSLDWNPLGLHPPMALGVSPPVGIAPALPESHYQHRRSRRVGPAPPSPSSLLAPSDRRPHGLRSLHNFPTGTAPRPVRTKAQTASLEIYDGFDFGFGGRPAKGGGRKTDDGLDMVSRSVGSEFSVSTSPSLSSASSDTESIHEDHDRLDDDDFDNFVGLAPRPHQTSLDGPEFYVRRSSWKRRGIVFGGEKPLNEEAYFEMEI